MPANFQSLLPFLELLHDAVLIVDGEQRIAFANRAAWGVFGYEPAELAGRPLDLLLPEAHRAAHARHVAGFAEQGQARSMTDRPLLYGLHRDGREVPVSISLANLDTGSTRVAIAVVREASQVKRQLGQVLAPAETDPLTLLGNRLHLTRCLKGKIEGGGRVFLLAYVGLAPGKASGAAQDASGAAQAPPASDELRRIVARRIKSHIREVDSAVRMAGDEFVLLFDGLANGPTARERVQILARRLAEPIHVEGQVIALAVHAGIAAFPLDGRTEAALLEHADRAMVAARRAGLALVE